MIPAALVQSLQHQLALRRTSHRQHDLLTTTDLVTTCQYRNLMMNMGLIHTTTPARRGSTHLSCTAGYTNRTISLASISPNKQPESTVWKASRHQDPITSVIMRGMISQATILEALVTHTPINIFNAGIPIRKAFATFTLSTAYSHTSSPNESSTLLVAWNSTLSSTSPVTSSAALFQRRC